MRLVSVLVAAVLVASCSRGREAQAPFRLGYFPNLTHAQALVGVDDGTFSRALPRLETRMFNAGPAAMEALLAGDLDAAYVGPSPAAIAYLRTRGEAIRVVAGAASGGAVLVVSKDVRAPGDLAGKRVGSPQLGNTQDVALRMWLRKHGLQDERGQGAVEVKPVSNPDILSLFARGDLAGAWVPEPWGARLVAEAGGRVLVDERTLWPDGRFPTTVLAVSARALERRRPEIVALVSAHLELTRRWEADRAGFARRANEAYGRRVGKPLPDEVVQDAFARLEPVSDPLAPQLARMAADAQALGFAPAGEVSGMVEPGVLQEIAKR
jgi:NitT/TauT family transport system substrate-binding protein